MININSRNLLGLILITCAVLASNQVNGLRCYQCVQGSNLFCDEADMFPVACPPSAQKCGLAYATINSFVYQWRGCLNATADANITDSLSSFGGLVLGKKVEASSYESCATDLCNMPLKCYFCTAGPKFLCGNNDTGVWNCKLKESSCGKVTYSNGLTWKGCLTAAQVSQYTDGSLDDFKVGVDNSSNVTTSGFYSCSTNLCNAGFISSAFGLVTILAPLVLSVLFLFMN